MLIIKIMHRNLFVITKKVVLRNDNKLVSCQVQETDKVSSSQQAHKYLQTDHICFQERKMFLLFAGSPSLGEFLFLNLDIAQYGKDPCDP